MEQVDHDQDDDVDEDEDDDDDNDDDDVERILIPTPLKWTTQESIYSILYSMNDNHLLT